MKLLPWELLDAPVALTTNMGSFDCVAFRFAKGNFAQDDRAGEEEG